MPLKRLINDSETMYPYKPTQGDSFGNVVKVVRTRSSTFFFKTGLSTPINVDVNARNECYVQELLRLLIPRQPKTYLAFQKQSSQQQAIGLFSEEVRGFRSYYSLSMHSFPERLLFSAKGLGEITMGMLIVAECDGKMAGNVGIANNSAIKLDGGEAMLSVCPNINDKYPVISADLDNLPLAPHYARKRQCNWLNQSDEGHCLLSINSVLKLLSYSSNIHREKNTILLRFLLLSPTNLVRFTDDYFHDLHKNHVRDNIIKRQSGIEHAAINNVGFCKFLLTKEAHQDAGTFLQYLQSFQQDNEHPFSVFNQESDEFIQRKLTTLKSKASMMLSKQKPSYHLMFFVGTALILLILCLMNNYLMADKNYSREPGL